jgi:exopolysaccharide biosynthesis polyprenyl glycosylphosphotransferase
VARRIGVADAVAAVLAVGISILAVRGGRWTSPQTWVLLALAPVVLVSIFMGYGLYRIGRMSPLQEFRRLFGAVSVNVIVLGLATNLVARVLPGRTRNVVLTVGWLGVSWIAFLAIVMIERKMWHRWISRRRASGELAYTTLVVGSNAEATDIAERLRQPGLGFHVAGLVGVGPERPPGGTGDPPLVGTVDDLPRVVGETGTDCLFVASTAVPPEAMTRVLRFARRADLEVRVSANMPEMLSSRLLVQTVGGRLAFALESASLSGPQAFVKRAFDLAVAGGTLLVTSPLWLASAVAIKVTSRGPVLFRQRRVGRHGRPFTIHKFRTMVVDAELRREELLALSRGPLFKLEADPRMTRVGRFLRRWSIDELPQLLNVLRGDMSMVGPRPLVMFDRSELEDWHLQRLEVPPGITGLWQISGRSNLTFDECVQLDTFYIENWSVVYDVFILLQTIPAVLRGKGAF